MQLRYLPVSAAANRKRLNFKPINRKFAVIAHFFKIFTVFFRNFDTVSESTVSVRLSWFDRFFHHFSDIVRFWCERNLSVFVEICVSSAPDLRNTEKISPFKVIDPAKFSFGFQNSAENFFFSLVVTVKIVNRSCRMIPERRVFNMRKGVKRKKKENRKKKCRFLVKYY